MTATPKSDEASDLSPETPSTTTEQEPGNASAAPPELDPLAQARAELARVRDSWLRTTADLENFRKRSAKELENARKSARDGLLKALLPVFDNLERAIQSAQHATDVSTVSGGLQLVQRQFV